MINANVVNRGSFPERHLMGLFLGVCRAVRGMHEYRAPPAERMRMGSGEEEEEEEEEQHGQGEQQRPLMRASQQQQKQPAPPGPGATPLASSVSSVSVSSYAHRDIKPANIMIDDAGSSPILMDLGSVAASPAHASTPSLALQIQDTAAEHSTMPYRAPELFDVRAGAVIDTKVDVWSLGCTLYACLVGKSPFEMRSDETGGSLSLCILGGDWRFPDEGSPSGGNQPPGVGAAAAAAAAPISEPIRDIVRRCLTVEPAERPDIGELIAMVEAVLDDLPDD
ncbi:hypothetical protein E4U41_006826 [Claviceps citrina]|nr:hypothetical protein E4U41_006826 [Claviceps citrina]